MSILQRVRRRCSKTRQRGHHSAPLQLAGGSRRRGSGLVVHGTRFASYPAMLDRSLGGIRCLTVRRIAYHGGYLPANLAGTVRYTTENLGRTLVRVDFDSGVSLMALPDDVILDFGPEHRTGDAA